jgi:hypothetical protein
MTKIKQSDFEGDTITKIEKPLTQKEKLAAFRKTNAAAISSARFSVCICSPTKAEILLMDQADGFESID